jgi:hypothetical protein
MIKDWLNGDPEKGQLRQNLTKPKLSFNDTSQLLVVIRCLYSQERDSLAEEA